MMSSNVFLVMRFVFFCLIGYLNLFLVVFTSWNLNATASTGLSAASSTVSLIGSCATIITLLLVVAQFSFPKVGHVSVNWECLWTVVLSLWALGSAIGVTVNHDMEQCNQKSANWSTCASSSLLVPTAWANSFALLAYFFTLFATTMSHLRLDRSVWSKTVYDVSWFSGSEPWEESNSIPKSARKVKPGFEDDTWTLYIQDIQSSSKSLPDIEKAPWAWGNIRRGVDQPFARSSDETIVGRSSPSPTYILPTSPLQVETKEQKNGSRFIERLRGSTESPFASQVQDYNKPIPLPRLSQWISAESLKD